jgi:hypothetical protein
MMIEHKFALNMPGGAGLRAEMTTNAAPLDDALVFREKVRAFDFSPGRVCGGCSLLEKNEEDRTGNAFPSRGGCLWAQGIIPCP